MGCKMLLGSIVQMEKEKEKEPRTDWHVGKRQVVKSRKGKGLPVLTRLSIIR